MILANMGAGPRLSLHGEAGDDQQAARAVWLDLVDPTDAERALVERVSGLRVPGRPELSEIERSSRLNFRDGILTVSTPMISRIGDDEFAVSPLGLVVGRERLVTIRFAPIVSLDVYAERMLRDGAPPDGGIGAMVGVLDVIVDRLADVLEFVGGELDHFSRSVFRPEVLGVRRLRRQSAELQRVLTGVGRSGELLSSIRDSLLGVSRIAAFALDTAPDWPSAERARLSTIRQDLASLTEYDVQISDKIQFLLDATLGFINIQQNNVIKILTVASIVGIPPTLIASIYGMNFKNIPELGWTYGYAYGLAVIALSGIVPLAWFWRRGWL